jgi:hypothetical protein
MEDLEPATGKGDLSMDELEAVAGGSGCGCFFYGNGKKDGNVCVLTGGGNKCGCFLVGAR